MRSPPQGATPPDDEEQEGAAPLRTPIAIELAEIKESILAAVAKRERLPQPLFWHLFSQRLQRVRESKERDRVLSALFGDGGSDDEDK